MAWVEYPDGGNMAIFNALAALEMASLVNFYDQINGRDSAVLSVSPASGTYNFVIKTPSTPTEIIIL